MTEGVWIIIGLASGVALTLFGTWANVRIQEKRTTKRNLKALYVEVRHNATIIQSQLGSKMPMGRLKILSTSSYNQTKETGVLADLPSALRQKVLGTYEAICRIIEHLSIEEWSQARLNEFNELLQRAPEELASLAGDLEKHLKIKEG